MQPKAAVVPSKNALRALRSLALSAPTICAGAAGSVCCLAVVHYHSQRRVRLAERIVETKKTLHSISKGRGNIRALRMFEAAERGEDFLLDPAGSPRRQKRRDYSAVAAQQQDEQIDNFEKSWRGLKNIPYQSTPQSRRRIERPGRNGNSNAKVYEKPFEAGRLSYSANDSHKQVSAADGFFPPAATNSPFTQKEAYMFARSGGTLSRSVLTTFGDQKHADVDPRGNGVQEKTSLVAKAAINKNLDKVQVYASAPEKDTKSSLLRNQREQQEVRVSSLSPSHTQNSTDLSLSNDAQRKSSFKPANVMQAEREKRFRFRPDFGERGSDWKEKMSSCLASELLASGYLRSSQAPFSINGRTRHKSVLLTSDHLNNDVQQDWLQAHGLTDSGRTDYLSTFNNICSEIAEHGVEHGYDLFLNVMNELAQTPDISSKNWGMIVMLYLDFCKLYGHPLALPAGRALVEQLLHEQHPVSDAVRLLYPYCGLNPPARPSHQYYFHAKLYLEGICDKHSDCQFQMNETMKVLQGTKELNIELNEHLVVPVIRSMCARGETEEAVAFLDEMIDTYDLHVTFYTISEVVRGISEMKSWSKLNDLLEKLHDDGLSRKKVHGFAGLLARAVEQYSYGTSPENAYDFLTYYMHGYGLIPTGPASTQVIQAFIRSRRFDLAQDWAKEMITKQPDVDVGVSNQRGAWNMGTTWRRMNATCEDVLNTCKAFTYAALRDPFSQAFRGIAQEIIHLDINKRISALQKRVGKDSNIPQLAPSVSLENIYDIGYKIVADLPTSETRKPRNQLVLEDLVRQLKAVEELNRVLGGNSPSEGFRDLHGQSRDRKTQHTNTAHNWENSTSTMLDGIPEVLKTKIIPPMNELEQHLYDFYLHRESKGLSPDHSILRYLCVRLSQQQRNREALEMFGAVHKSRWVQGRDGTPFDLDLFSDWLKLALELSSSVQYRDILWAVLDSKADLRITAHFILLARFALPKTQYGQDRFRVAMDADIEEAKYLHYRLKKRRWQEMGRPDVRTLKKFDAWTNSWL